MAVGAFFQRLKEGLTKSRETWVQKIGTIFQNRQWDENSLGEMEESLITADVGVKATDKLMQALRRQSPGETEDLTQDMSAKLQTAMVEMLRGSVATPRRAPLSARPWVIIFLGVNGVGKTTTIGKLAAQYRNDGKKVLMVAGDTFRAAAIEQLDAWGKRVGVDVVKHKAGADPSAVVFDGMQAAKSRNVDVLLIDTAGRLHTKVHLIEELKKIRRVITREAARCAPRNPARTRRHHRSKWLTASPRLQRSHRYHRHRAHQTRRHRQRRGHHQHPRRTRRPRAIYRCRRGRRGSPALRSRKLRPGAIREIAQIIGSYARSSIAQSECQRHKSVLTCLCTGITLNDSDL